MKFNIENVFQRPITDWLPITMKEVELRGWEQLDVIVITGDAYVDHPGFGAAVIGRIIEQEGLKIGIIPQPNWRDDLRDFKKFGAPKLFFAVTSGNMDSMINHYTAGKRLRNNDAYTPGGEKGYRPDYALTVYCQKLKEIYPDSPIVIGGIEGSLRRITHYDYWADKLFPSILEDTKADLLVYGMGEKPLRELISLLKKGVPFDRIRTIKQTGFILSEEETLPKNKNWEDVSLNSHDACLEDKLQFASNFKIVEIESNKVKGRRILQDIDERTIVINPPFPPLSEKELDGSFDLPFTRLPHPKYKKRGPISAYEMIKFSVNMHRGCFGGCSFCTISAHQGKFIASRSQDSIMREVDQMTEMEDFKGYISDLGGPSGNMYQMKGKVQEICDRCQSPSCIHPVVCSNLDTSHQALIDIYDKVSDHPKVKKAFVSSGIRYDLLTKSYNKNADDTIDTYLEKVVTNHTSGRLKVAPEHTAKATLKIMRKPAFEHFQSFKKKYDDINEKHGLAQPLIPYFISSHPGCEESDMAQLASDTKDLGFQLEQVQDFTPTPMTVATIIYYTGVHPYDLRPVFTAKSKKEKQNQHLYFFWYKKENQAQIKQRLVSLGKSDLAEKLLARKKKSGPKSGMLPKKKSGGFKSSKVKGNRK